MRNKLFLISVPKIYIFSSGDIRGPVRGRWSPPARTDPAHSASSTRTSTSLERYRRCNPSRNHQSACFAVGRDRTDRRISVVSGPRVPYGVRSRRCGRITVSRTASRPVAGVEFGRRVASGIQLRIATRPRMTHIVLYLVLYTKVILSVVTRVQSHRPVGSPPGSRERRDAEGDVRSER
jgi:hypothetical protein